MHKKSQEKAAAFKSGKAFLACLKNALIDILTAQIHSALIEICDPVLNVSYCVKQFNRL